MRRLRNTIRQPRPRRRKRSEVEADAILDLHGDTAEQALVELARALSDPEIGTLLIVHGKGSGVLRLQVRAALRRHPGVCEIRHGEDAGLPGGDGVTWCRLG